MKKWLFFVVAIWVSGLTMPVLAQRIALGLRGGLNLSNVEISDLDDEDSYDTKNRPGVFFGVVGELGFSNHFALQPELQFTQYGFRMEESFEGGEMKLNLNYNYLQVPVLAKFNFGSENAGFSVMAGPHFGFGVGDIRSNLEFLDQKEDETMTWEEADMDTFDMGITGGAGFFTRLGPGNVGLDVRYQLGLRDTDTDPDFEHKVTNRNFQIGLNYLIPLFR